MAAITHCCKKKTKKKKKKEQKPPPSCHHRHLQSALDRFPISSACNYHRLHQTAQSDSSTTTHAHHHLFCPTLLAYCAMPTVVYNNYTDHLPASGPAPMADTGDRNGGVRGKKKKKKKKIPVQATPPSRPTDVQPNGNPVPTQVHRLQSIRKPPGCVIAAPEKTQQNEERKKRKKEKKKKKKQINRSSIIYHPFHAPPRPPPR
jgi:hypothetical protein